MHIILYCTRKSNSAISASDPSLIQKPHLRNLSKQGKENENKKNVHLKYQNELSGSHVYNLRHRNQRGHPTQFCATQDIFPPSPVKGDE